MKSLRWISWMGILVSASGLLIATTGCGSSSQSAQQLPSTSTTAAAGTSGSQVLTAAQANKNSLEAGKQSAQTVTAPPQPIPQGATQGATKVNPPQPAGNSYLTWQVGDVDLDGDGVAEAGVAMVDSSNTLYVWWADVSAWSGDELDGFLWLADKSVGFILLLDDAVGLACAETTDDSSPAGGCIGCDDQGDCEEVAINDTWRGGN